MSPCLNAYLKAYIPLQRKPLHIWAWRCSGPLTREFRVGDTNMLVPKKPCGSNATPNLPNATPSVPYAIPQCTQRETVEYTLRWVCEGWVCIVCLVFVRWVEFAYPTRKRKQFSVEYGLKCRRSNPDLVIPKT